MAFYGFDGTKTPIYFEHSNLSELEYLGTTGYEVIYCYSETEQSGYWHYDTDGVTPVLW